MAPNHVIMLFCVVYYLKLCTNGRKTKLVANSVNIINSTSSETLVGFVDTTSYYHKKYMSS